MKDISKILTSVLASCFLLLAASTAHAETINTFSVKASLAANQLLTVTENITYDFGTADKHGIFRDIPVKYARNGANYNLHLKVLSVKRDGATEPYTTSNNSGQLEIKIGDANRTLTGVHAYEIVYQTNRAINSFADHDELYWNVAGNAWEVPIEQSNFSLGMPDAFSATSAAATSTCFTGEYGSTEKSCTTAISATGMHGATTRLLESNEGFTVVFGFPKGILTPWTTADRIWMFITDNAAAVFPIIALLFMFLWWWFRGRDPKIGTIIPEYEAPKGFTPALVATVAEDGTIPTRSVTATIIDLAARGFLKIRFEEVKHLIGHSQTYIFVKQTGKGELTPYEQGIYTGLFASGDEVKITDLKNKFYTSVASFKTGLQADLDGRKLYDADPQKVRGAYLVIGFLVSFGLFYVIGDTLFGAACAIVTGLVIGGFGILMPRRTPQGTKVLTDIKGFSWFLSVTEKDRLDFHNAPERTPDQFMALLPFAIALSLEKKWAAQFASLTIPPPHWAEGNFNTFNAIWFANNLSDLHSAAASSAYAAPSSAGSGGSGFSGGGSGGGFGGGGGGSW